MSKFLAGVLVLLSAWGTLYATLWLFDFGMKIGEGK